MSQGSGVCAVGRETFEWLQRWWIAILTYQALFQRTAILEKFLPERGLSTAWPRVLVQSCPEGHKRMGRGWMKANQGRLEAMRSHFLAGWRPGNALAAGSLGWDRRTRFRKVKAYSNDTKFCEIRKNRPAFRKQELAKISRTGRQRMQNGHR